MNVPGQTSSPSVEGLSFFCFFSFLKERKEGLIRESNKASGSSFLLLIEEKKQKKIKASGMPAKFDLVHVWRSIIRENCDFQLFSRYPAKLPRPRQRAFSCLDARKEAKEDQGIRDASQFWPGTCLEILRRPISGLTHGRKHRAADQTGLPLFLFSYMRSDQ